MKKLSYFLDYNVVRIFLLNGRIYEGRPINVDYADENEFSEDMLAVEVSPGRIVGLRESEIAHIEIVKE